jgi:hypothetical protein
VRPFERPPVVIRWIAQPDACDDCKQIAAGSPYERLPTWPGLGDTRCAGACRCAVEGARAGNVMATARTASPPPEPLTVAPAQPVAAAPAAAPVAQPAPSAPSAPAAVPTPPSVVARFAAPFTMPPSRPVKLTAMRMAPLERRWTLALGALIFLAVIVAMAAR